MSEANGYATKDGLLQLSRKERRYADKLIPGWGKIQVQSVTAAEFCRMDAAKNVVILHASGGNIGKQAAALRNYFLEVVKTCVVKPAFSDGDAEMLLALDSATADAIKAACLEHCNIDEASVEGAEKNSQPTSGAGAPTESGST